MGFLNKFFGETSSEDKNKINWIALTSREQLTDILDSDDYTIIFKHSTRCGISRFALSRFEREFNSTNDKVNLFYLDILSYRNLSDEISAKLSIRHESPQIFLLKNGMVLYNASHSSIDAKAIKKFIDN